MHQRLHILGNTFEDNGGAAIHVGSSDGVEIRGSSDPATIQIS